jgi:hypothetical protein
MGYPSQSVKKDHTMGPVLLDVRQEEEVVVAFFGTIMAVMIAG